MAADKPDEKGNFEDGRRWWMSWIIKPGEVYEPVSRSKLAMVSIRVEEVLWGAQKVRYVVAKPHVKGEKQEVLEMTVGKLYEYYKGPV